MKIFIRLLSVPMKYLFPVLLLMCMVGNYTVNNRLFDCWVLLAVGVLGYVLVHCEFDLASIVLGYVLGDIIETNYRTAMIGSNGRVSELLTRPIALGLLAVAVLMVMVPLVNQHRKKAAEKKVQV